MCFSHFFKTTLAICEGFRCNFWKFHASAIPEFHLVGESNAAPRHRGTAQAAGCSIAACGAGTQQARLGGFGGSQLVKGYVDEI